MINGTNGVKLPGVLQTEQLPRSAVLPQALTFLAVFWGLAVVSIIIPIIHFLSVPFFFAIGLGGAIYLFLRRRVIAGAAECPGCRKQIDLRMVQLREQIRWPLDFVCPECGQNMWVEQDADKQA